MIGGLGALLLEGPILMLIGLSVGCVLVGFGYGWGRRSAFREIDEGRAAVRSACEDAVAERVSDIVPGQRVGEW